MKRKTIKEILEELRTQDKKVSPGDIIGDKFEEWLKKRKQKIVKCPLIVLQGTILNHD